jgi:hypothetical protein
MEAKDFKRIRAYVADWDGAIGWTALYRALARSSPKTDMLVVTGHPDGRDVIVAEEMRVWVAGLAPRVRKGVADALRSVAGAGTIPVMFVFEGHMRAEAVTLPDCPCACAWGQGAPGCPCVCALRWGIEAAQGQESGDRRSGDLGLGLDK